MFVFLRSFLLGRREFLSQSPTMVLTSIVRPAGGMTANSDGGKRSSRRNNCYEEAIRTLNRLQSNSVVLEAARKNPMKSAVQSVPLVIKYLAHIGLTVDDLDRLNVIHVSGTKGKGSTCAFVESILRRHGYKTGFYSSPHVVAVRERIRINGRPLSEDVFSAYFWNVYNQLAAKKEDETDMPAYFKFLTIMAFDVFLKEKVDVAVIEVGIGGQYDCTNVIRRPVVCGVSSLGIDHTNILGSSLAEIAWQKAGIFKPGVQAFTCQQDDEAMKVLRGRAKEIGCSLSVSSLVEAHDWGSRKPMLGLAGEVQRVNAGLAVHLASHWLDFSDSPRVRIALAAEEGSSAPPLQITEAMADGLRDCQWPGRHQVLRCGDVTYFLDGAHTPESIQTCVDWFQKASNEEQSNSKDTVTRILLFNSTGNRHTESLLSPLIAVGFDYALFCPNIISVSGPCPSDQLNVAVSTDESLARCERNRQHWWSRQSLGRPESTSDSGLLFECVSDALRWITSAFPRESISSGSRHVLVTGSLHLVGAVLGVLDPGLGVTVNGNDGDYCDRPMTNGHRRSVDSV